MVKLAAGFTHTLLLGGKRSLVGVPPLRVGTSVYILDGGINAGTGDGRLWVCGQCKYGQLGLGLEMKVTYSYLLGPSCGFTVLAVAGADECGAGRLV